MASEKHQPWYKRVLITFWIIHLGFMLWFIASASFLTTVNQAALRGGEIILIIICSVCALLDIIEIILFVPGKLKPLTYLIFQVIKTTIWLILFLISVVNVGEGAAKSAVGRGMIAVIEIVVVLLSFVATLIYGSTIYHRARHGRNTRSYQPALDEEGIAPFTLRPSPAPAPYSELGYQHRHGNETAIEMGPGENAATGRQKRAEGMEVVGDQGKSSYERVVR
ncbi:MAG: hypothetical protein M1830_000111 [Pleopsidium flavum]|nr:MAG: hypothetical protein M1830_000111 [Pleopsidium flavum]